MARTTGEILGDIQRLRGENRRLYERLAAIRSSLDNTMQTVALAHLLDPEESDKVHKEIDQNDNRISTLTRELCE